MVVSTIAVISGCGGGAGDDGGRVQVVAGFFPLAEAARQIGGANVEVRDLTPPGVEPHDLELTTRELEAVEDADVVFVLGNGFQPALEKAARRRDTGTVAVLSALGREDERDPHVWLDPVLMRRIVEVVAAGLVAVDPDRRAIYEANAGRLQAAVERLEARYRQGLADCDRRVIVTSHEAFGHLARRYRLTVKALTGITPDVEPDPRTLARLSDYIRSEGVTTVFTEPLLSARVAAALARSAGARTAVLDPAESGGKGSGRGYVAVMDRNLAALREGLGCR
jgi:zinc transport system substrate-binding protein